MQKVLVLYGGVSPEHEVSIVSALQVMHALVEAGYEVMPGYVSKEGEWYLGDSKYLVPGFYANLGKVKSVGKRIILPGDGVVGLLRKGWLGFGGIEQPDVIFPVFHGKNGEDGSIQGLLQLTGVPYVGSQLTTSAVGMDKYVAKRVAESIGLSVVPDVFVTKAQWEKNQKKVLSEVTKLGSDVFMKPNGLGSSIGIQRVKDKEGLRDAIEVGLKYDSRVLIEKAVKKMKEVNVSIMGNDPYTLSVTEEPVTASEVLSFEDKYLRDGGAKGGSTGMASAERIMPARVSKKIEGEVKEAAERFFRAVEGTGIARIDFMVEGSRVYFNEINTMPGSLAFYLWKEAGVSFPKLVDRLVKLAVESAQDKQGLVTTFESNILASFASRGGMKGGKV